MADLELDPGGPGSWLDEPLTGGPDPEGGLPAYRMIFEVVRDSIGTILANAARSRYTVLGYQKQASAAATKKGANRSVTVYFQSGAFNKAVGSSRGGTRHEATYKIELGVAVSAKGSALDPNEITEAEFLADRELDTLMGLVYQILMDQTNYDLGLTIGTVANRWVDGLQKDNISQRGELPYLTGTMNLTVDMNEPIYGDAPSLVIGDAYNVDLEQTGDTVTKAGVAGTLGG